jgi:P-type Ca2+ transporter type 2C
MSSEKDDPLQKGLTDAVAKTLLDRDGPNELPRARRRSAFRLIADILREPMLGLLLTGGFVYLLIGDLAEALILLAFACLSVTITVVQEARTERVLEALRDLTSPRALVIRDGAPQRIPGREVVRGDLIMLSEGDRVPADARVIQATGVTADESLLTGEAVPVQKQVLSPLGQTDADAVYRSTVFSGTLIVGGTALAEATATGPRSEIGKIGKSLTMLETEAPHLQRQTRRMVTIFAALGGTVSLVVVALYGYLRGDWLDGVLAGIAVGMAMLPEEFPMVLAVFMAMGAWRISKARVLTRRASAIESLGAASVLCTDKTGTLTQNRMAIAELRLPDGRAMSVGQGPLPAAFLALAKSGTAASSPNPFDPMEKAFHDTALLVEAGSLLRSYPVAPDLLAMTQVWRHGDSLTAYAKGAPEAIAKLCRMTATRRAKLDTQIDAMAQTGLRVLGVATARTGLDLPDRQTGFHFRFVGLVGLADPLRASVPAAVAECQNAGIRVIMITGDYPVTARAIARQAGIAGDTLITGDELSNMDDRALAHAVKSAAVFARIRPEQKLRIVTALKAAGAIIAMTGDGVNDAPALKAAHIGVAMGGRGTDVAREASSIVLLDDDFSSIVATVRLGRRIYGNLRKAMSFILAVHVPIAGLALMPLILGLPVLFGPVHIAFLEMIIDPVCALVFEAEADEDGAMKRPPRDPAEPIFSVPTIIWSVAQGVLVLAATAGVYLLAPQYGQDTSQTRTLTFVTLVFGILALILVDRSASPSILAAVFRPNRALAVVLPVNIALLAVVLFWPPARAMFRFAEVSANWLAVPLAAGVLVLVLLEAVKLISSRTRNRTPALRS